MLKNRKKDKLWIHILFIIICLCYILPFVLVVSVSFTGEESLMRDGFRLFPKKIDLTAYRIVFKNPKQIIDSYTVTTIQALVSMVMAVLIMALCGYSLSRRNFAYRSTFTFIIFFTMLFGGGLIPSYLLNTRYLHLDNKLWIYILPHLVNAWRIIIFRTFFQGLPESLSESAKIDGASELRIFFKIILPLSTPVLATMALFTLIERWNDWMTSLLYIRTPKLYSLQYLLHRILNEAEFLNNLRQEMPVGIDLTQFKMPTESMRYAMLIVAAGPMLVVFPFFQKYFSRGLTIGAVKG